MVHQFLLKAKNYRDIAMRDFINKLVDSLVLSYKPRTMKMDRSIKVDDITMGSNEASACALIITELTSNSLKHAFHGKEQGEIYIMFKQVSRQSMYSLIAADNGVGLPTSVDIENPTTIGLGLVKNFVAGLSGEMCVERAKGTKFTITFPQN